MAIQRTNPLPVGRYWVDVFDKDALSFRGWLADHSDSVNVENHEVFLPRDSFPSRTWYLFGVTAPTDWQGPGFPTIADTAVTQSSDVAERPAPPPSTSEQIDHILDEAAEAGNGLKTAVGLGIFGGMLYGLYKLFS